MHFSGPCCLEQYLKLFSSHYDHTSIVYLYCTHMLQHPLCSVCHVSISYNESVCFVMLVTCNKSISVMRWSLLGYTVCKEYVSEPVKRYEQVRLNSHNWQIISKCFYKMLNTYSKFSWFKYFLKTSKLVIK